MDKRLFVAVDIDLATEISAVQSEFDGIDGLRYTDPEQAHITLKFLGATDTARIPATLDALETAIEAGISDHSRHRSVGSVSFRRYRISALSGWVYARDTVRQS